jgi:hypothetical protein
MRRYFKMTHKAQQALHTDKWIPTQFLVDGDAKDGYSIHYVGDDLIGFNLVKDDSLIRSFYAVKRIVEDINTNGIPKSFPSLVDMRSFAWKTKKINTMKKLLTTIRNYFKLVPGEISLIPTNI